MNKTTNTQTIGNPELMDCFEDYGFSMKTKKNVSSQEHDKMIQQYKLDDFSIPKENQIVSSIYSGDIDGYHIFDINGYKSSILVEDKTYENVFLENAKIGDKYDILITKVDQNDFTIYGSIAIIFKIRVKNMLDECYKSNKYVMATVTELSPAGYKMEIEIDNIKIQGFMPNTLAGVNKLANPESIVGETFEVMIESYSQQENTYIVNRRKYLQTLIPDAMNQLHYGQIYTGNVTGTTDFGVFLEFNGCLTGMIHKANIIPEWQNKFQTLKPGDMMDFYIKEVVKNRIILTQILKETIWDTIENGQVLNGVVKQVKPYGALVSLDDETMGLIHNSELEKTTAHIKNGDNVKVKVISVERMNRKIFLALEK